jgi:hypothetical protein
MVLSEKVRDLQILLSYGATMSHIIEPSCYEEASSQLIWRDAMMEEYQSIMNNNVWDIVPRPNGKSVVTSKWIYKIKHAAESIEKKKKICGQRILSGGGNRL